MIRLTDRDVIALNLTDLRDDGEADPLSERILELATAAARVVSSDPDHIGAVAALTALRDTVAGDLEHFAALVDAVLDLLQTAHGELGD